MHNLEDGYELWLRYLLVDDPTLRAAYRAIAQQIVFPGDSPTLNAARMELRRGLKGLLGEDVQLGDSGTLLIGTPSSHAEIAKLELGGAEGYTIQQLAEQPKWVIAAQTDLGVLYGVFHFLRLLQTRESLEKIQIVTTPKIQLRMLNHWDNLDGTIERGYAGHSLWDWHKLPDYLSPRYTDYARACASIGINGTVLNNVNAHPLILTEPYSRKVAALANVFRPYGIRVWLSARFSAPIENGGLLTADPLAPEVAAWWRQLANTIYALIPDFGGFLVKANSEGQPGPHDYGCAHADGANLLADALAPHGGHVIWRAFVYDADAAEDRAKQAYTQLTPQDGRFRENVLLQVKNGPIDFQPREPIHPLFGAMPKTPLMLEVQLTQEYLGLATHLAYLAPLFKEALDTDTYAQGIGSTVAKVIDGSLDGHAISGIAAVANTGDERNWCGHPFAASSWYAYGRLAWDYALSSEQIAAEWLRMTFSSEPEFVQAAARMMITSREAVVLYMMPLGLHHIFAVNHHYGPGPWVDNAGRPDWTAVYYHQADARGIGFDRTASGSNAISQYHAPYRDQLENRATCPESLLLWFHHIPWDYRMQSGRALWDELCYAYNHGVEQVREMRRTWDTLERYLDAARFAHVRDLLRIQEDEACWWRDACLLYFQTFSGMPIPPGYEQPRHSLDYYRSLTHYYVPGIEERRFRRG